MTLDLRPGIKDKSARRAQGWAGLGDTLGAAEDMRDGHGVGVGTEAVGAFDHLAGDTVGDAERVVQLVCVRGGEQRLPVVERDPQPMRL